MRWIFLIFLLPLTIFAENSLFYTPDRIAAAKENINKYPWAQKIRDRIMNGDAHGYYIGAEYTSARELVKKSDDFIWELQPDTTIGRFIPEETKALCPQCGPKARNINYYCPWAVDPLNKPYKIQCRNCKYWFPDEKYPDDGSGVKINGKCYYMLREYAHFVYMSYVGPGAAALSQAYLLTGDREYARKACILLTRVAAVYPNYDDRFALTWYGEYGGQDPRKPQHKGGLISDRIWECFALTRFALAFDAVKNYPENDPELVKYFRSKGIDVNDTAQWREFIRRSIFRPAAKAIFRKMIKGNDGMHQAASLAIALALNDHSPDRRPNSRDLVDFVYHWDGHAANAINNLILPDGGGHESPGYNGLRLEYIKVERMMEAIRQAHPDKYPLKRYPEIWASPKGEKFFELFEKLLLSGVSTPSIGDSAGRYPFQNTLKMPVIPSPLKPEFYLFAAKRYRNPAFAAAIFKNGRLSGGELWENIPEDDLRQLAAQAPDKDGEKHNRLLDSSGIAILESGKVPECRTVMLNYAGIREHWQADVLSINIHAFGMEHLRDVGYPVSWNFCRHFDYHNLAHNTVTIDEKFQDGGIGRALLYFDLPGFSGISAEHTANNYKKAKDGKGLADIFRRTVVKNELSGNDFYVLDIFDVAGGTQHDQSWHSLPVKIVPPQLNWKKQSKGTLAGENVPEFGSWVDQWGDSRCDVPSFITNVSKAPLNKTAAWTWESGLPGAEAFRIHIVPVSGTLEAIMGSGRTPVWPKGKKIDYLFLRRKTKFREPTRFLTILEPFKAQSFIRDIKVIKRSPLIVEVIHKDGSDRFTVSPVKSPSVSICRTAKRGDSSRSVSVGEKVFRTTVKKFDGEKRTLVIGDFKNSSAVLLPGRKIRIFNRMRSNMFTIEKVEKTSGGNLITIAEYPLLARAVCSQVNADGQLQLDADLVFARYMGGGSRGTHYVGAWFDAVGTAPQQLAAATENGLVTPVKKLSKPELYVNKEVSIWQAGVGDQLEIAIIEEK